MRANDAQRGARGVRVDHVGDVAVHEEIRHNIDETGCIVRGTSAAAPSMMTWIGAGRAYRPK